MYLLSWHHFSNEIPLPQSRGRGISSKRFYWPFNWFSLRFSLYFTAHTKWSQHHFLLLKISPNYHTHSSKRVKVITSPRPLLAWWPVAWLLGVATGQQLNHNLYYNITCESTVPPTSSHTHPKIFQTSKFCLPTYSSVYYTKCSVLVYKLPISLNILLLKQPPKIAKNATEWGSFRDNLFQNVAGFLRKTFISFQSFVEPVHSKLMTLRVLSIRGLPGLSGLHLELPLSKWVAYYN